MSLYVIVDAFLVISLATAVATASSYTFYSYPFVTCYQTTRVYVPFIDPSYSLRTWIGSFSFQFLYVADRFSLCTIFHTPFPPWLCILRRHILNSSSSSSSSVQILGIKVRTVISVSSRSFKKFPLSYNLIVGQIQQQCLLSSTKFPLSSVMSHIARR